VAAGRRADRGLLDLGDGRQHALYFVTLLNSLTLASLYFIVASGFTLVFGLMRNVNLAHGSLYLLGGYVASSSPRRPAGGSLRWRRLRRRGACRAADPAADPAPHAGRGAAPDDGDDRPVDRDRRRAAVDLHRQVHQMEAPAWLQGPIRDIPLIRAYSAYRLSLLGSASRSASVSGGCSTAPASA
jgi:branched-chain amino acid transport system permease protein